MAEPERLSREEGDLLLSVARNTIENRLSGGEPEHALEQDLPEIFKQRRGTFVTLTKKGSLRGCIGHIIPQGSLISGIRENAVNAAFRDPRFPPLGRDEWADIHVEISILTEPAELAYRDADDLLKKLRPNVDGVIIKKGFHQATFLPQVWEQLPEKIHFLRHLCLKAGLERDEWKSGSLQVSTYQVQAFEE